MLRLPGTGQTQKFTTTFGEDADHTIDPPYFINNGDGTVTDTVTGLMWQQTDGGEMTVQNAEQYPGTLTLGGHTDWRLPNAHELFSIQNLQHVNPSLDSVFFTTNAQYWWSSEKQINDTINTWCTNAGGGIGNKPDTETVSAGGTKNYHVRAVRYIHAPVLLQEHFVDNGDGTITDSLTDLIWQKAPSSDTLTWENALTYSDTLTLSSDTDWRLPNIKELQSISDETLTAPSLNSIFQATNPMAQYWASTSLPNFPTKAWYLDTHFGITTYGEKTVRLSVRCVRSNTPKISTGISAVNIESPKVYPNPFTDHVNIENKPTNAHYELSNMLGEVVYYGADIESQNFSVIQCSVFTLTHSLSLGLAAARYIVPDPRIIEPLIAFSILVTALENLFHQRVNEWRLIIIFIFGLVHGMGFAGALKDVGIDTSHFISSLLFFNIGVELGQVTIILAAYFLVSRWWGERDWYKARVVYPASSIIACVALYWAIERILA
ncbi:unnamed protein product [Sphagnum jensenii]|uniref:Lcl C-terminal domain-containing protein n=1 Tax=Sphagnum jensenii TaxID=128206 RepID=A0ABP0VIN4_9BRYO